MTRLNILFGCCIASVVVSISALSASALAAGQRQSAVQSTDFASLALLPIDRLHNGESDAPAQRRDNQAKRVAYDSLFGDGFEAIIIEPPLQGQLRLTRSAYISPDPDGTQIETLSQPIRDATGFRFLQSDTGLLERVSPNPQGYLNRVDFDRLDYTPGGTIEAPLTPVDLSLGNPAASTSGCEASDFDGFPVGNIALIQRGTCTFRDKASNAEAAGAVGVIIFNQGTADRIDLFAGSLLEGYRGLAPVVSTSFALGQQWADEAGSVFRIRVDSGQKNNAWELVPVVDPNAPTGTYWIHNSATGELLATRPSSSSFYSTIVLDRSATDDQRAWWQIDGASDIVKLKNVDTRRYLAVVPDNGDIILLASNLTNLTLRCPVNYTCEQWRLTDRYSRPPSGSTRIRSALGESYLHLDGNAATVGRIKSGWPNARWVLEPVQDTAYRRLLNVQTGDYLYFDQGSLQVGEVQPGWTAAMWEVESASEIVDANQPGSLETTPLPAPILNPSGYIRLRNRLTQELLYTSESGLTIGASPSNALRSMWVLDDEAIPTIADYTLRSALESSLGKNPGAPILSSEAAGLYQFIFNDIGLGTLSGLENFPNLVDVQVARNNISDVTPLASLTEIDFLDLSRNPLASIAPLEGNSGLADGDRINLLRTQISRAAPTDGAPMFARRVTMVPGPGLIALHEKATDTVVDAGGGAFDLVTIDNATNGANWSIEYDVGQDRFRIRNHSYFDPRAGYLTWEDQNNNLELGGVSLDPEWRFELVSTGQYRIVNTRLSGPAPYLQTCSGDLEINSDNPSCVTAIWYIDGGYIQDAIDRATANYYDPKFGPTTGGYTRIQNTQSREFIVSNAGVLGIGQVAESFIGAQWKLVPVQFDTTYYFAIQNRQSTTQYLFHNAGTLQAGPLPAGPPDGSEWATVEANQPFLFAIDGTTSHFLRPLQDRESYLRANGSQLTFASANSSAVWRLDGGVKTPAPAASTGFVQLQQADPPLYATDFSISWRYPSGPTKTLTTVSYTGAGNYLMPANAQDIRVVAVCVGCGLGFSDLTILDKTYDRPPNRCIEARGTVFDPHTGKCDPTQGSLAVFAGNAAQQVTCEIAALVSYVPTALDALAIDDIVVDFIAGNVERGQEKLFSKGDLRGPDFSGCDPYQSMSFGAGASAGVFNINAGGGIGVVWGITPEASGALSYTSTGSSVESSLRLLAISTTVSLGLWKTDPKQFKGEAIGFSLQGNRDIPVDFSKLKKLKKVGLSAGITLWFGCNTGTGLIVNPVLCTIREDSDFLGFSFDFTGSIDASLPLPGAVAVTYSKTCAPANFSGTDC